MGMVQIIRPECFTVIQILKESVERQSPQERIHERNVEQSVGFACAGGGADFLTGADLGAYWRRSHRRVVEGNCRDSGSREARSTNRGSDSVCVSGAQPSTNCGANGALPCAAGRLKILCRAARSVPRKRISRRHVEQSVNVTMPEIWQQFAEDIVEDVEIVPHVFGVCISEIVNEQVVEVSCLTLVSDTSGGDQESCRRVKFAGKWKHCACE